MLVRRSRRPRENRSESDARWAFVCRKDWRVRAGVASVVRRALWRTSIPQTLPADENAPPSKMAEASA